MAAFRTPRPRSVWRRRLRLAAARLTRYAAPAGHRGALRILTYHRVNDGHPGDRLSVRPEAFIRQMEALQRSGRPVVTLRHAVAALNGKRELPAGAVAITFDDGFADNFTCAAPALERHGFPATFFVATGYLGTVSCTDRYLGCCQEDGPMDWEQVRELIARGHDVGGHTRSHPELGSLSAERVWEEVDGCRRDIADRTGTAASLFCYPRGSESTEVRGMVARAGFEAACTVYPGANPRGTDVYALRRTEVSGDDGIADFRLKLDGGFDGWHRLVQRLQSRGPT